MLSDLGLTSDRRFFGRMQAQQSFFSAKTENPSFPTDESVARVHVVPAAGDLLFNAAHRDNVSWSRDKPDRQGV
jgi:hypothetical protein